MNKHSSNNLRTANTVLPTRKILTVALAVGLGFAGAALAQSTTGNVFGQATMAPGQTVVVKSENGVSRAVPVDAKTGRYTINSLPLGTYSVSLMRDGQVINTRNNVTLRVGAGIEVSFAAEAANAANATELNAVTVHANALPAIDVSSVDSRTVITAQQLAMLPLRRSAESIALLAPGAVAGSRAFGNVVSFGGSSGSENAYYINGYNTTNPLTNIGGTGLPYGVIDQQETYTGGYSAMYGRSDGGVINQVGKRGTNDWHFGAQVSWAPAFAAASPKSTYYPNGTLPATYGYANTKLPGTIYRRRGGSDVSWDATYDLYVGGPLVQDKLFLFAAGEIEKQQGVSTSSSAASVPNRDHYAYSLPKSYIKLDWNINESNIVELTSISSKEQYKGTLYKYNYATNTENGFASYDTSHKYGHDILIGKYTSYITNDLTFSATYGTHKVTDYEVTPGLSTTLPYLSGVTSQDPAITGGTPIRNGVPTYVIKSPDASSKTHGLRLDLEYQLGSHHLAAGIDNMDYHAHDEGQAMGGPGYAWIYGKAANPSKALNPSLGVGAPGGKGYYARKYIFSTTTSMGVKQDAQYVEDRWQVNDRWLLNLGLRNDQFQNLNNSGQAFVKQNNQWAPRLGFSWDVLGDSTLKVFGNLGRYYLALPSSVAIRGGSASTFTSEYFTYTGINPATGAPTGLTPMGPGPVSANGELGQTPDPKTVAATNLKSEYQDEAILGLSKALGPNWVTGAKLTVRKLQSAIDDVCDMDAIATKIEASGLNPDTVVFPHGCLLFNPGQTNTFNLRNANGNGYTQVSMTTADWGFTEGVKRKYYALDLFLEHPFDGKWQGRIDYTFSRSYGNTEGQINSNLGQADVSKTQDWDSAALMVGSNGILANDRTHQFKAFGAYQLTPEWMLSGSLRLISGAPKSCLGYMGPDEADPLGYGSSYHFCNGSLSRPGDAGRLPWTRQLDLGVTYRPAFAGHKLAFALNVFNVFNEQRPILVGSTYETSPYTVSNTYGMPSYYETPRYARFTTTYDF